MSNTKPVQVQINYYRTAATGVWCYATFIDGECDSSDDLGIGAEPGEGDARAEAATVGRQVARNVGQDCEVSVTRVEDC